MSGRNPDAVYLGSSLSTKLKVMGVDLAVMGDKEPIGEDDEVVSYSEPAKGIYKKLIVRNDRLAGAIVLGDGALACQGLETVSAPENVPSAVTVAQGFSSVSPPSTAPDITLNKIERISRQKQPGLCAVGLNVPVGRITSDQLFGLARVAHRYGNGEVRITTSQNVIVPNVAEHLLPQMTSEPLLAELRHDPSAMMRGVVSCTGIDYCHMALIETKELALKTARELDERLGRGKKLLTMHWSGCQAGCGNHTGADIGLLGKNAKIGDEIVDAVDVFVGGQSGPNAKAGTKLLEDVPCSDLPRVLEQVIPYVTNKRGARSPKKDVTVNVAAKA